MEAMRHLRQHKGFVEGQILWKEITWNLVQKMLISDWYPGREGSRPGRGRDGKGPSYFIGNPGVSTCHHGILFWVRIPWLQSPVTNCLRPSRKGMIPGRHLSVPEGDPEGAGVWRPWADCPPHSWAVSPSPKGIWAAHLHLPQTFMYSLTYASSSPRRGAQLSFPFHGCGNWGLENFY